MALNSSTNGIVAQILEQSIKYIIWDSFFVSSIWRFCWSISCGYFFDNYGSYDYAWYMAIGLSIFATIVHFPIDERRVERVDNTI